MVVGAPVGCKGGVSGGIEDAWKVGEVNLRILLDQLQLMKAELRNQLRYVIINIRRCYDVPCVKCRSMERSAGRWI